jgi:hypothetical protein
MAKPRTKRGTFGLVMLVAIPLFAILAAAFWAWTSLGGPPMPVTGYVALILGVVFSLVVGFGLMGLLFYSSRHGYDEPFDPHQSGDDDWPS